MDLEALLANETLREVVPALAVPVGAAAMAALVEVVGGRILSKLARRTSSATDDRLVEALRRPVAVTVLMLGLWYGFRELEPSSTATFLVEGMFVSIGAMLWTFAALKVSAAVLDAVDQDGRVVQPATRPLFDLLARVIFIAAGVYFLFIAWQIDVTAWLASAGIVGLAVGFASQDTLGNLFAGFSILVDRPYKLGDYLVIDGQVRGRVTMIGMRSTRLLTRDDVEVIIPNAQMAAARIVNESGGPHERQRVSAVVGVAYDSDMELVRRTLLECAEGCKDVLLDDPLVAPRVRLRELGSCSLEVHLLVWIPVPELRGRVLDELNTRILHRFRENHIDIPFPTTTIRLERPPRPLSD